MDPHCPPMSLPQNVLTEYQETPTSWKNRKNVYLYYKTLTASVVSGFLPGVTLSVHLFRNTTNISIFCFQLTSDCRRRLKSFRKKHQSPISLQPTEHVNRIMLRGQGNLRWNKGKIYIFSKGRLELWLVSMHGGNKCLHHTQTNPNNFLIMSYKTCNLSEHLSLCAVQKNTSFTLKTRNTSDIPTCFHFPLPCCEFCSKICILNQDIKGQITTLLSSKLHSTQENCKFALKFGLEK